MTRTLAAEIRFWSKVDKTDDCWNWTAKTSKGYGLFWNGERGEQAHRFAYRTLVGPIPDCLVIDHLCENTKCVNPAHLEAVTQRVNILRGKSLTALNELKTHCKRGHEFTVENTYASARGYRACRSCEAAKMRRFRKRQKELVA